MRKREGRPWEGFHPLHRALVVTLLTLASGLHAASVALAQDLQRLDAFVAETQEAWPVPGLAVAIVKDGQTVLAKGYGVRELGTSEVVDEHTLFAIASNTKAFTAAALAIL
ncbi:MAG: serine hydrolase domain-containing protein, partial [Longimicrobiales bacterium]